jgi:hypothetical protein
MMTAPVEFVLLSRFALRLLLLFRDFSSRVGTPHKFEDQMEKGASNLARSAPQVRAASGRAAAPLDLAFERGAVMPNRRCAVPSSLPRTWMPIDRKYMYRFAEDRVPSAHASPIKPLLITARDR